MNLLVSNILKVRVNLIFLGLGLTVLAGCGGGGGASAPTPTITTSTVSGNMVKGPVSGAAISFYALNADGSKAAQLGTTVSDTKGNYTVTLTPAPTTPFLAETSGGTYVDEVTGLNVVLSATDKLTAVLPVGTTRATVTPLTHIAAARAQALAAGGTPLATAVDSSNTGVATQYGIADIVATLSPAANNATSVATASRDERIYALVLAGIVQQASSVGVRAIDLANALAEDAKDGILDGNNGAVAITVPTIAGGSWPLPATAGTTDVQTAINAFIVSINNQTKLTQVNIPLTPVNLGVNTAGGLYSSFPVLPTVVSGQDYTATLTATGGTPPYTCALKTGSLDLPSGYYLVPSTCQIASTTVATLPVLTTSISSPFTITLTDSAIPPASVDIVELRVTTVPPKPTFTPVAGMMTVNVQGSTPVATAATGGASPYYFAHDSFAYGAHPVGTAMDVNGNLSGTPSQTGVFNFKVCVIDLVGAKNCQMTSVTVNPALTVSKAGTGSGTVTSSPAGINCGATCLVGFANGTSVTLTATPATGSVFGGWSGACSGTGSCVVSMSTNKTVTATFNPAPAGTPIVVVTSAICEFDATGPISRVTITGTVAGPIGTTLKDSSTDIFLSLTCHEWSGGCIFGSNTPSSTWTGTSAINSFGTTWAYSVTARASGFANSVASGTVTCPAFQY